MTVGQLRQRLGIQLAPKPEESHTETLWGYGYRQLSDFVAGLSDAGKSTLRVLGKLLPSEEDEHSTFFSALSSHFSQDFELWATASTQQVAEWRGATIVFGEIHNDRETLRTIGLAMHQLIKPDGSTRVFVEGDNKGFCSDRRTMFSLSLEHCQALEEGSKYFARLEKLRDVARAKAKASADLVCEELGIDLKGLGAQPYPSEYATFVNRHYDSLPLSARLRLAPLIVQYNKADDELQAAADKFMSKRDEHMVARLRRERTRDGLNIVIVGATHLKGMREHLHDLPCIFMVPRGVVARMPEASLGDAGEKRLTDEL